MMLMASSSRSSNSSSNNSVGKSDLKTFSDSSSTRTSSNSRSGSHSNDKKAETRKTKKKNKKTGWFGRLMTSSPDEKKLLKAVLWLPVGIAISGLLYYLIIDKMRFEPKVKALIGAAMGLLLALTFAFSYQTRCVLCLVLPTFVGKAGRSYIAAFAIVYLIQGPITNIINNSKEVVRSLGCTSELLSNHSREKWRLKLSPVESVIGDITKDGFLLSRLTVFCQIVKLLPGAVGMDCKSMDVVPPGFGPNFQSTNDVIGDMEKGFQVRMQYKVVGEQPELDYTPVIEMKEKAVRKLEEKASVLEFLLSVISYILTFTFLLVFKSAYTYNRKYLSENRFDNKYITPYFRHIDSRRKARGQKTLLPLKKSERKDMVFPTSIGLTGGEKKSLVKGTVKLLFRVVISVIVIYMDYLLFQVMEIIAKNSRVEYHQEGEHKVDIKVYGRGFMSALVHSVLTKFNTKHKLDKVTTNHACLPSPSQTDIVVVIFVFLTYFMVWLFLYLQAYGLRIRRAIASFFYRKREKTRVLFLYNEMYRKRIGFLRHMRHKVRKALRDNTIKERVGVVAALRTSFPRLCLCLKVFIKKKPCFVCEEPNRKDFYQCPVPDCSAVYCQECWRDIKRRCLACGDASDQDSDFSELSELTSDEDDDDDV